MKVATNTISPLQHWARKSPDCLALITTERDYSWQALEQTVQSYVYLLQQHGLAKGDVLTCVAKNSPELVLLYLACMELGAVCAITMPQPSASLQGKLHTLYSEQQLPLVWLADAPPSLELEAIKTVDLNRFKQHPNQHQVELGDGGYQDSALASIIFTSGSTGTPKAVAHCHQQHFASASGLLDIFKFNAQDTWLLSLPMYHVSGLAIIYRWLHSGACLKVGCGDLLSDIDGVTHASLVATQLSRLLESGQPLSLTHVLLGGSHVPLSLSQQAAKQGIETWLGYGMTEAASTVTAKQIDADYSAGKTLKGRKVELREGRIFIGGDTLASGYYQQGSLTPIKDELGWFDSKDLGIWSIKHELVIKGRADNQFISGGENIHCEEIEQALNAHPDIQQALIVPIEDAEFGARPIAFVQSTLPIEQIDFSQWLASRLVKFKHPKHYLTLPNCLFSGGIKVSRKDLKDWVTANTDFTVI
ncbi:o-succinylbenzoate--CoA ligase [Vibrio ponticus]|uniref:O-succinylbenzoate--CoA ligase n=1 Tax=Vibrio ponticus TaxID=265668 RepID=A0A3N3DYH0_9VIBR|nr:o-succinylbenzoate--CoA ligase [Vibrio ponticus]ROV59439.1 o-succinylbenzoate--CoA ligase [Vibrio ponticus]